MEQLNRCPIEDFVQPNDNATSSSDLSSGLELISMKKCVTMMQLPCNIDGVGDLKTSWIGQKGVKKCIAMCIIYVLL